MQSVEALAASTSRFKSIFLKGAHMQVPSADLCIRQGNDESWDFKFKSYDDDGTLIPFDLTGSTLFFRAEKADGTYLSKTLTPATPANGEVTLSITVAESRLFTVGRSNRWELERHIDSTEKTLAQGYMIVREGINEDA